MRAPEAKIPAGMNPVAREARLLGPVKDKAQWDALAGPEAKLEALRQAVVVLIERGDQDNEALRKLFMTFDTDDGGQTVLRRNLVVANGANIVVEK
jgi:hypothetical protein